MAVARPIAGADPILDPDEAGLVREAPGAHDRERVLEMRCRSPEVQDRIVGSPAVDGQGLDRGEVHAIVMGLGAAAFALGAIGRERPGRIGENHAIAVISAQSPPRRLERTILPFLAVRGF